MGISFARILVVALFSLLAFRGAVSSPVGQLTSPPVLPAIVVQAWVDKPELTLPENQTTVNVYAQPRDGNGIPLVYRWVSVDSPPSGKVTFSPNDTESADVATATFSNEVVGTYRLRVIVSDGVAESVSEVSVVVTSTGSASQSGPGAQAHAAASPPRGVGNVHNRPVKVIVRLKPQTGVGFGRRLAGRGVPRWSAQARAVLDTTAATASKSWFGGRLGVVEFPAGTDSKAAVNKLRTLSEVLYAVPDQPVVSLADYIPNDPQLSSQWGLANTADIDIDAPSAWDQTTGSSRTVIAVLDTGIDYTHPDLYLAVMINNDEIPPALLAQLVDTNANGTIDFYDLNSLDAHGDIVLNGSGMKFNQGLVADQNGNGYIDAGDLRAAPWTDGVDNDGNGYVDDLTGWDNLNDDSDPMDVYGHGTHVAGILGARGDNATGVAGINWHARILPERFQNGDGGTISGIIEAIDHAVSLGANVINASWGTFTDSPALKDAIRWAGDNGVVFVAAAGNQSNNIDNPSIAYYPAAYTDLPNLIGVASVDPDGNLSGFSNYGPTTVEVAAPGASILSTGLGGGYVLWSGTSMATPYVAGVVSLVAGLFPDASPGELVDRVLSTVKPLPALAGKVRTGGMVGAYTAVNTLNVAGPRVVSASPIGDTAGPVDRVTLIFDSAIAAATFTPSDVAIVGPAGTIAVSSVNRLSDVTFEVQFPVQSTAGAYTVTVGPEIEDLISHPMDQDRDGSAGEPLDDRFAFVFRLLPSPQVWTLDDGDAGYSASGGWSTYAGAGAQGDFAYKGVGSGGGVATWSLSGVGPGRYRVWVTWEAYSNRATNAPYTVLDGTVALGTVAVDQTQVPAGMTADGVSWYELGVYDISGDTLGVSLTDQAGPSGRYVIADAVRVERVGEPPAGPEVQVLVDGVEVADGTGSMDFGGTLIGTLVARTVTVRNSGTADLALGTIVVPSGFSLVTNFGTTLLAPGQSTDFVVQLDAVQEGSFGGVLRFDSSDANESPYDIAVSGTVTTQVVTPQVWTLDDGDAGYSASGGWSTYAGAGAQGDFAYKGVGSGGGVATWSLSGVGPGRYRVWVTWEAYSNRATNAPYTVLDGTVALGTVAVDQTQVPAGMTADGVSWYELGVYDISGDTLGVSLTDQAGPSGRYVIADAVRVERVGEPPAGPEVQVLVDGVEVADGTGSMDFGGTLIGTLVARTVTVRNSGTADLALGTIVVPSGFSLVTNFGTTLLAPGQSTDFVVQLDAVQEGSFGGVLRFDSSDANESPYDIAVSGTVTTQVVTPQVWTLDDGDAGYSASGGWSTYAGAGAQGDFAYKGVGSGGGVATWSLSGVGPGRYRVWVTWEAYSNRATNAPYTVLDGTVALGTVAVDQTQVPAGMTADGVSWYELGVYDISGDTLGVSLTDQAGPSGRYVIADAVRVERVGEPPAGPEVQVLVDGVEVADGTGSMDFGGTLIGTPVARTVTVRNSGTADLALGTIVVPSGFSLVTNFGTTLLAPGQSTDFVVQLDAVQEGSFGGVLRFDSSDANESPYDIAVSGTVTTQVVTPQVWTLDDGDAGYSASGGWSTYAGAGAQGDFAYKGVGSGGGVATWSLSGVGPGRYRVWVTWEAYSNRATNAPYTVLDGTVALGTVAVDQTQVPAGMTADGVSWYELGVYDISGDTLGVSLTDQAGPSGRYVIADAVRVERVATGGL